MKKNILITGGKGFIGSHLVDALVKKNNVYVVDNGMSAIKYKNPKATYFNRFIEDFISPIGEFDECYHLASAASPKFYQLYPLETITSNTTGTINAINLAKKTLFTSTSEVYGEPLEHPQKETYRGNVSTTGPRACYDESKRLGETICSIMSRKKDVRIARIFNTYGARMRPDDGRVIINFYNQIKNNVPVTIYGDGFQTRSLCYVDDTVRGLISIMENGTNGEIYNIGNPQELMIQDIAYLLYDIIGAKELPFDYKALPKDDPTRRKPDITKALDELNWSPRFSLREGLKDMIKELECIK